MEWKADTTYSTELLVDTGNAAMDKLRLVIKEETVMWVNGPIPRSIISICDQDGDSFCSIDLMMPATDLMAKETTLLTAVSMAISGYRDRINKIADQINDISLEACKRAEQKEANRDGQ